MTWTLKNFFFLHLSCNICNSSQLCEFSLPECEQIWSAVRGIQGKLWSHITPCLFFCLHKKLRTGRWRLPPYWSIALSNSICHRSKHHSCFSMDKSFVCSQALAVDPPLHHLPTEDKGCVSVWMYGRVHLWKSFLCFWNMWIRQQIYFILQVTH